MRRETIQARKRFAAEVAARDEQPRKRMGRGATTPRAAQDRAPSERMLLFARASVARRLVADGVLDAELALAFAVWPTPGIQTRERLVGYGTLTGRAFGTRGNE